jgi:chemotaxis protein methyltransferase WspC
MAYADFEDLLKASIGLDVASVGPAAVARAVEERQAACGLPDAAAYLAHLRTYGTELQALIEAVVVPETWFFRDRGAFAWLARVAADEWLPAHPTEVMRLLSLPSSTGEEPYSIAMALIDAGVPPQRFRVDAIDISARALAHAAHAVYGKNAFRDADLAFRDRHFEAADRGHRPSEQVRGRVEFAQGNLLAAGFLPGAELYDVVFCRNVLIYFDELSSRRAAENLYGALRPGGYLFLGHSESMSRISPIFTPIRLPEGIVYQRPTGAKR